MSKRGGKKNAVSFARPPEPAFLRRIKEQIGYKEGPTIDTKKEEQGPCDPDNEGDRDDERPTVVVLQSGDLTAEEVEKLNIDYEPEEDDGKVRFKKPMKRASESNKSSELRRKLVKTESSMDKVNNKSLLSFDDEEDDD